MITTQSYLIDIRPTSFSNEVYSRLIASATPQFCCKRLIEKETRVSDRNASDDYGRQKRTRFAALAAPSEVMVKQTRRSPIYAARDHVNFHVLTLHDKLANIVVRCAADL